MKDGIPDKHYFKIGEVSRITGLRPHVLRYWETEFSILTPEKTSSNQRLYQRSDIENILLIKQLLYKEGFTVAGANKRIKELLLQRAPATEDIRRMFNQVRREIVDLLDLTESSAP